MTKTYTYMISLASLTLMMAIQMVSGIPGVHADAWVYCAAVPNDPDWAAHTGYEAQAAYSASDINAEATVEGQGTFSPGESDSSSWWQNMGGDLIEVGNSGDEEVAVGTFIEATASAKVLGSVLTASDAAQDNTFCLPAAASDTLVESLTWYDGAACEPGSATAPVGGTGTVSYSPSGDGAANHIFYRGMLVDGSAFAFEWPDSLVFECDGAAWDDDSDANLPADAQAIWTVSFVTVSPNDFTQHIVVVKSASTQPDV